MNDKSYKIIVLKIVQFIIGGGVMYFKNTIK